MNRGVPYDHELEYIESTGSQYIDTGITKPNVGAVTRWEGLAGFDSDYTSQRNFVCAYDYISLLYYCEFNQSQFGGVGWNVRYFCNATLEDKRLYPVSMQLNGTTVTYSVEVNGETITKTATPSRQQDSAVGSKFLLFCLQPGQYKGQGVRIGRSRLFIDNILVGDYIPVSVNGVAMMYDRVTGTFPKRYGTFVAGPVVSTPLMGVHMYPHVYTPADYVQDGLLAGWSGIAQGGIPNVWKDFSGHRYDLTINTNTSHFESNYLDVGSISTAAAYMAGVLIPGVKHMEICCYVSQKTTNALLFYNGAVPSNMILASHSTAGVLTSNTKRHTAYTRTTGYYSLSATHDILYADGVRVVDTTFTSDSWSGGSNSLCLFGRLTDTSYGTAGRIYSARAYSRELTPEEAAHNDEVDKITFNIPDPYEVIIP